MRKRRLFQKGVWCGYFYDDCWRANLHLVWPATSEVQSAYIKKVFGIDYKRPGVWDGRCTEVLDMEDAAVAHVIFLRGWSLKPSWIAALSHEAFHATEQILSKRGMRLGNESSEAYAYLIESIVQRCMEILGK